MRSPAKEQWATVGYVWKPVSGLWESLPGADDGRLGAAAVGVEVRVEARRTEGTLLAAVRHACSTGGSGQEREETQGDKGAKACLLKALPDVTRTA
jgi:hypothetical protein